MQRELDARWDRLLASLISETLDPDTIKQMKQIYWYGVATGVHIFDAAIDGKYGRSQL